VDFFWTPTYTAIVAPLGGVLVGVIAFIGARRGSKDLQANQERLIKNLGTA